MKPPILADTARLAIALELGLIGAHLGLDASASQGLGFFHFLLLSHQVSGCSRAERSQASIKRSSMSVPPFAWGGSARISQRIL